MLTQEQIDLVFIFLCTLGTMFLVEDILDHVVTVLKDRS